VGFISQFFHNHSVGRHYAGLIRHLARNRFRTVVLRFPGADDEMSRAINASADEVVVLTPDLAGAREMIAGQKLDALYYTDIGMDPLTYFLAFARLAPVQCVTNGHPVTTGIPAIDYFVSSDAIEPAEADAHYTEQLVRMQNIPNYYERPRLEGPPRTRRECGLRDDWHIYLCAQNLCKLQPDFDLILGEILRRDAQGRVILFHGAEKGWSERLAIRLRRTIPDVAGRVGFLDHQRNNDFLHLLTLADAVLDSTHFCGGTTTAQALAVGAPVVTLPGEFMRGRITDGCYRRMGMSELSARDAEDYVQIAVRLGIDPVWRQEIREKILAQNSILYDNPGFIRELEEFFIAACACTV
jgi:predicted O-linked N-acetylglucosamine transferase (SPINDLY family)